MKVVPLKKALNYYTEKINNNNLVIFSHHIKTMHEQIHKLIEYSDRGILSKDIVRNEKFNITLFCMAKETRISEHTSTRSGFVYVIEGRGVFNFAGNEIIMSAGVLIPMDENTIHSIRADENTSFILALAN